MEHEGGVAPAGVDSSKGGQELLAVQDLVGVLVAMLGSEAGGFSGIPPWS